MKLKPMKSYTRRGLALVVIAGTAAACSDPTAADCGVVPQSSGNTAAATSLEANDGDPHYKKVVDDLARTTPADSIVTAAVQMSETTLAEATRDIESLGGEVTSIFTIIPWVVVDIPMGGLVTLSEREWVSNINIGRAGGHPLTVCDG